MYPDRQINEPIKYEKHFGVNLYKKRSDVYL